MKRWAFILVGAACVLPLAAIDPAAALLLLDVEFLALMGTVGLRLAHGDAMIMWWRFLDSPDVLIFRAGWALTRDRPVSLLEA